MHLHLLKFTCWKQDLQWRSSNLGQEVLKKTLLLHWMWGWRREPPREHSRACNTLCREVGTAPQCPATASTNPSKEDPREGDPGRISSPKAPALSAGWKYQLQAPLFCWLIKMGLILKVENQEGSFGWNTGYPLHKPLGKLPLEQNSQEPVPLP